MTLRLEGKCVYSVHLRQSLLAAGVIIAGLVIFGMQSSVRGQTDQLCSVPPKSKLQIIIIAVTEFENPDWKNETSLNDAVEKASNKLSKYFEENFQGVEIHRFQTH